MSERGLPDLLPRPVRSSEFTVKSPTLV